ncbi:hypothetical protein [Streptomyces virginiae]|uniref:hypothetical protein n=1 Tax=Streptomyces virginiae TaxID=1961 RepID=UPI002E29B8F2|nr:hypothetical protein [Streptomyces virginiae]
MAGTLDRLKELLGEPNSWGWARPRLWEAAEEHLDIRLPADYKAFLDLYGPGAFDGFLWMDRPVDGTAHELERLWPRSGGKCDLHLTDPGRYPFPFHPRPGGLIEWGGEEDGTVYYFLPGPNTHCPDEARPLSTGGDALTPAGDERRTTVRGLERRAR